MQGKKVYGEKKFNCGLQKSTVDCPPEVLNQTDIHLQQLHYNACEFIFKYAIQMKYAGTLQEQSSAESACYTKSSHKILNILLLNKNYKHLFRNVVCYLQILGPLISVNLPFLSIAVLSGQDLQCHVRAMLCTPSQSVPAPPPHAVLV